MAAKKKTKKAPELKTHPKKNLPSVPDMMAALATQMELMTQRLDDINNQLVKLVLAQTPTNVAVSNLLTEPAPTPALGPLKEVPSAYARAAAAGLPIPE